MDYRTQVQKALDYIEDNLAHDIDPDAAARAAGYSPFHFARIFRDTVGMTPADYIRRRRITEIVRCAAEESRPISEIAFAWGFNSKENFTRAFKREHHILPTEFRAARNSLRLFGRVTLVPTAFAPSAEVVTLDPFRAVAYPSREDFPPHFWNRYNVGGLSRRLSGGAVVEDIGICRHNPGTGRLDYWIGVRETDARGDRTGTVTLEIPGGLYLVVTTPPVQQIDFVAAIRRTWDWITDTWMPDSGYRRRGGYEFETYTEASRSFSEKIYIPVERKDMCP